MKNNNLVNLEPWHIKCIRNRVDILSKSEEECDKAMNLIKEVLTAQQSIIPVDIGHILSFCIDSAIIAFDECVNATSENRMNELVDKIHDKIINYYSPVMVIIVFIFCPEDYPLLKGESSPLDKLLKIDFSDFRNFWGMASTPTSNNPMLRAIVMARMCNKEIATEIYRQIQDSRRPKEEKTLHVVSALTYKGTLKQAFREMGITDDIIYLPVDFSYRYIPKDFSDKELCFSAFSNGSVMRDSQFQQNVFEKLREFIDTDFTQYGKVVVWHGLAAFDLLLLYLMSVLAENNLYQVDIRDCKEFMEKSLYPDMDRISPNDITSLNMYSYAKPLSKDEIEYNKKQWHRWAHSSSPYHFSNFNDGIIREYSKDFMDDAILEYAKKESRLFSLVVKVFTRFEELAIIDTSIIKRILELNWEHKLNICITPCLE